MIEEFDTEFLCNSICWIRSLPDSELGPSRRMIEDVELIARAAGYDFNCFDVHDIKDMKLLFEKLTQLATDSPSFKPILHLDMHGDEEEGLLIGGADQYLFWDILAEHLRPLNTAMENNLCVVGAACFGLSAVTSIMLAKPTPFFMLIAPQDEVKAGYLEKSIPPFYQTLFKSGDVNTALTSFLTDQFKMFHCERMLFRTIAQYVQEGCKGKSGQKRREYLLTEVFLHGMEKTEENLKTVRKKIKEGIRPDQNLLDRYAERFLIGRQCSFDMSQLLELVNKQAKNPSVKRQKEEGDSK